MKNIPTLEEFRTDAYKKIRAIGDDPALYTEWVDLKFLSWKENNWCKCVKGKDIPIKRWKPTLTRCLPYRERNKARAIRVNDPKVVPITKKLEKYG